MRLLALAIAVLFAVAVPAARAGGSQAELAVSGASVFVAGDAGLRQLDASTGRVLWAPLPTEARYELSLTVAGGALWVASIANGYVDGRLTRIDLHTHAERIVLRVPQGSVLEVDSGGGYVYALVGRRSGNRLVRFTAAGRPAGAWNVADGGRMVADASGCWVSADGRLLHVDGRGRERVAARVPFGDVAAGAGAVWIGLRDSLVRVDERTGAVRRTRTGPLDLGGFQHDVAVGGGFLWTVGTGALERRDLATGRLLAAVLLPRIAHSVAVTPTAVWVATTQGVRRLDPRTLQTTLRVGIV